jgi:hypothetical protein
MNTSDIIVSYRNIQRALHAGDTTWGGGFESRAPTSEIDRSYQEIRAELAKVAGGFEAAAPGLTLTEEATEWVSRVSDALTKLETAERKPGVLTALQDEAASLLQSYLGEKAVERKNATPAAAGGFEAKFDERDIAGWLGSLVTWLRGLKKYFRARPKNAELASGSPDAGWYRLPSKNLVPSGLLLDGLNPYLADHLNDYGPNGYVTLEFNAEHLTEFVHEPTGEVLWRQQLA